MPIHRGGKSMKLLKIENHEGYYLKKGEYKKVDSITKEDILAMLKTIYDEDDVEFDKVDDASKQITMPSQSLVYDKLYEKFSELKEKKAEILASVNTEFRDAKERYCTI